MIFVRLRHLGKLINSYCLFLHLAGKQKRTLADLMLFLASPRPIESFTRFQRGGGGTGGTGDGWGVFEERCSRLVNDLCRYSVWNFPEI